MKDIDTLIKDAQRRDPHAFEQLYRICARETGWYCKRLCGNEFDAQDLLQEVWLTAWQKLPQYAGINFPAWLRSIAHNTFLNKLKKYRLEQLTEELPDTAPEDELLGPVHITEQRMMRRLLLRTIDRELTPVQRMTVLLYYYDELSVGEIARRMECSEGTAKSRLNLARRHLREAMGQSANTFLTGVPCVLPALRYEADHAGRMPLFYLRRILPHIPGRSAVLAMQAAGIGAAAAVTVTGTAFVLQTQPATPGTETEPVTAAETHITETADITELSQTTTAAETTEAATFPTSGTGTPMTTTAVSSVLTSTAITSALQESVPVSAAETTFQTDPAEPERILTETTFPETTAQPASAPAASTSTETGTETETTAPLPSAPVLPGFTVEVWEEDGQYLARILPDTAETTERLKLYYSLAQPPEGFAAAVSSGSGVTSDTRTLQYPHESGEDVLVLTQRTRSAASPVAFGECFVLGAYELTAVNVGTYPGWLAVSREDPAACTLEWDVGDYLFTMTAGRSDPESLIAAARNLRVG